MFLGENYPWEVREDANTISRYKEIESNPERLRKAKECIQHSVNVGKRALGEQVAPPIPGRKNPATIMSMRELMEKKR